MMSKGNLLFKSCVSKVKKWDYYIITQVVQFTHFRSYKNDGDVKQINGEMLQLQFLVISYTTKLRPKNLLDNYKIKLF